MGGITLWVVGTLGSLKVFLNSNYLLKQKIQELSCISAVFYILEGLFHPGMSAGWPSVEILFQSAKTSPGMLGSGVRDRGLKGKKWKNQNRAEHPLEIREFWFYCRGIARTHGIPAFSHIHGRVVREKCQGPLLQGRLMTLKFVIEICTSL